MGHGPKAKNKKGGKSDKNIQRNINGNNLFFYKRVCYD